MGPFSPRHIWWLQMDQFRIPWLGSWCRAVTAAVCKPLAEMHKSHAAILWEAVVIPESLFELTGVHERRRDSLINWLRQMAERGACQQLQVDVGWRELLVIASTTPRLWLLHPIKQALS